jgi:hypothetical protein
MQDFRTATCRWISRKRRGDVPFNQCANGRELGSERVRDAIDLIRGEPLTRPLGGKQHGASSDLLAQTGERRGEMCGHCHIAIGRNAELAWKECRAKFSQHAGNLATRWAVARRHRATRKGGIGGGECATQFRCVRTHRAMPLASKSPS